jgi:hypothetical protein
MIETMNSWIVQLVKLVEIRVKELEVVQGSSQGEN